MGVPLCLSNNQKSTNMELQIRVSGKTRGPKREAVEREQKNCIMNIIIIIIIIIILQLYVGFGLLHRIIPGFSPKSARFQCFRARLDITRLGR